MTGNEKLKAKLNEILAKPGTDVFWYHRVGSCLLILNEVSPYKSYWVRDAARTTGLHRSTFFRAMLLAELYSVDELQSLKHLSWTALRALVTVRDDKLRRKLQQQAEKQRWSVRRLQWEINIQRGKRPSHGGRKRQPEGEGRDLRRLAKATREWQGFVKDVWPGERLRKRRPNGKQLAVLVDRAFEAMTTLLQAVESRALPEQKPSTARS
jgi:hypothetical protein